MKVQKTCNGCQKGFEIEGDNIESYAKYVKFCPACTEIAEQERLKRLATLEHEEFESKWRAFCPESFQKTNIAVLPKPEKVAECMKWNGKNGLMLFGGTRRGKSRCAWLLVRRELERGRKIIVMDSLSGFDYGSQFAIGAAAAEKWVLARCKVELVLMDDLFKAKFTDSFEAAVFAIVDYRLNHELPILGTCNDTGDSLTGRMSDDRGAAFVARLKESCEQIVF